jgi:hypothetical protein
MGSAGSGSTLARRRCTATSTSRESPRYPYPQTRSSSISRVNTWPGRRASSTRRRNSVGVRAISPPGPCTECAARSMCSGPSVTTSEGVSWVARRRAARTRATSSGIWKGLVT